MSNKNITLSELFNFLENIKLVPKGVYMSVLINIIFYAIFLHFIKCPWYHPVAILSFVCSTGLLNYIIEDFLDHRVERKNILFALKNMSEHEKEIIRAYVDFNTTIINVCDDDLYFIKSLSNKGFKFKKINIKNELFDIYISGNTFKILKEYFKNDK